MMQHNGHTMGVYAVVAAGLVAGCAGSGGYGETVRFTARAQSRADEVLSSGERFSVPQDAKFTITETQRRSEGGGSAESTASADGTARCQAALSGKGLASAEFQIGHMLFNGEDKPLPVTVSCDCKFAYEIQRDPAHAPEMIGLKFYVKDSNRSMLGREVFVAPEGDLAAARHESHEAVTFKLTLEPGMAYQMVLAGRVDLNSTGDEPPISASLDVSQCTMTVSTN